MLASLTDAFSWRPDSALMSSRACARVRMAEAIIALPDDMNAVAQSAAEAAEIAANHIPPGAMEQRSLGEPLRTKVREVFQKSGGDNLLRVAEAMMLPIEPESLIRTHIKLGTQGVLRAMTAARLPESLRKEKAAAATMLADNYHEAIAEQIEQMRAFGDSNLLPVPVNLRSPKQEIPGMIEDPMNNPDFIDIPSQCYPAPRNLLRYRKSDLDHFLEEYRSEIGKTRAKFAQRVHTMPSAAVIPPHLPLANQSYGIEIEGYFRDFVPNQEGARAIRETFEAHGLHGWNVTQDWSIKRPGDKRVDHPEVVSPVFSAVEAPGAIARAMHILQHLGFEVNESCGLHVNVGDSGGIGLPLAKSVVLSYGYNQAKIDSLLPAYRHSNTNPYAQAPQVAPRTKPAGVPPPPAPFADAVRNATSFEKLASVCTCMGKNAAVNLKKAELAYIEFRQLHGTLNPAVVLDFMHVCGKFVNMGRTHPMEVTELPEVQNLGGCALPHPPTRRSALVEHAAAALARVDEPTLSIQIPEFPT